MLIFQKHRCNFSGCIRNGYYPKLWLFPSSPHKRYPVKDKEQKMHQAQCLKNRGFKQSQITEILGVTVRPLRNYLNGPTSTRTREPHAIKLDKFKLFIYSILDENPYYNYEIL
jgi:hypothetical protein